MFAIFLRLSQQTFERIGAEKRAALGYELRQILARVVRRGEDEIEVYWYPYADAQTSTDFLCEVKYEENIELAQRASKALLSHLVNSTHLEPRTIVGVWFSDFLDVDSAKGRVGSHSLFVPTVR